MTLRLATAAFALVAMLAAPGAQAQKPKTSAAPPALPEGNMGKKKKKKLEQAGPASLAEFEQTLFDERVKALQRKKSKIREGKIQKIQQILDRNPYHERKAELYHRLAESHWEEAKYRFLLEMEKYRNEADAFDAGTLKTEPDIPIENFETALEFYRRIQRELPNYDRIDEVTYHLAKGLLLEGRNKKNPRLLKEGVKNLKRIVKQYPRSRFVPESYLALGEYFFNHNMLFYAKNNYEAIINNHKRASMFNYALYKLAWVYYNLREFEKSVGTFKSVVSNIGTETASAKIEFRDQALNDLVRVFAEIEGGWKSARSYFLDVLDEDGAYVKLRKLAEALMGMDKDEDAIALFEHFLDKFPSDKLAMDWWDNILGIRVEQNHLPNIEKDTLRAVGFFNQKGSWYGKHKNDNDRVTAANDMLERRLLWIGTKHHQEAQRLKDAKLYTKSVALYRKFLEEFNESKHAYRVNFYLAEILYDEKKDYPAALAEYEKVLKRDDKGQFTEDAALGAVYCYDDLLADKGLRKRATGKGRIQKVKLSAKQLKKKRKMHEETELHELEAGFVRSVDVYTERVLAWLKAKPEIRKKQPRRGERIPEMNYIAAQLLYRHGKYRDAVKRLQYIFDYDKNHKFAAFAVNLLIDAYARLRHWEKVEDWATRLIKAKNFKVKSRSELNRIRAIAISERAREMALRKEFGDAVEQNLRIVKEMRRTDPELAATALYNVAAIYEKARDIPKAVKTYTEVRKKFPKASIAPMAQFTIGVIYESQTEFAKAAKAFEKMDKFKDYDETPGAILNAGLIWEALGKPDTAIKAYRKYLKLFKKHEKVAAVALRIGVVYDEQKTKKSRARAVKEYKSFVRKYKEALPLVVEAYARHAAIAAEGRNKRRARKEATRLYGKALNAFQELLDKKQKPGAAKYYAAQAAFETADYEYQDFHTVVLDKNAMKKLDKLKDTVVKKAELHQAAEKAFQAILDYKEPQWNAAALFRNGLLYFEFAQMLLDAPMPDNLSIDVEDQYRFFLEQKAAPIQEKSLTAFGYALKLAHDQKVYSDWSKQSALFAAKVNPDEFPVPKEDAVGHEHTRDTLTSASFIRFVKRGDIVVDMSK